MAQGAEHERAEGDPDQVELCMCFACRGCDARDSQRPALKLTPAEDSCDSLEKFLVLRTGHMVGRRPFTTAPEDLTAQAEAGAGQACALNECHFILRREYT